MNDDFENTFFLEPEILIAAYKNGIFPMAESKDGSIYWYFPERRAIFDIYNTKIAKSTRQLIKKKIYTYSVDVNFEDVIKYCGARDETWINSQIIEIYTTLFKLGYAHSVEVYRNDSLVGGLYGVAIGGAFFGESMFNLEPNTAKLAFAYLLEILKYNKFELLDSQFINKFTEQLGAIEIDSQDYLKRLKKAINLNCNFFEPENYFKNI
ncbi:MAG: leucyl/phenylalanyl-tRNA--protein transferase [Candidatus Kapaibacteriota bacterium]